MFKSRLYDLFSLNYANELLGSYVTSIFTMYYYMSLCNIPLLTPSLEPLHWFALYCGCSWVGPLLSLLKAGCYPYFSWNYGIILCNFWPILKKSSSIKPLTRNHSYLVWRVPRDSCFLFVRIRSLWPIFTISINDLR